LTKDSSIPHNNSSMCVLPLFGMLKIIHIIRDTFLALCHNLLMLHT
jgi:hypothetical protein